MPEALASNGWLGNQRCCPGENDGCVCSNSVALVPGGYVWPACLLSGTELKTINDFLFQSEIDNINLFKVGHYLWG